MNGSWIKVVVFVLLIIMVTSIVSALLDPGLGKPNDSRRTRHPAGFSISYPLGWGGTAVGNGKDGSTNYIRLAQERKTGPETTINADFTGFRASTSANAKEGTFQGQPAFYSTKKTNQNWQWLVQFQRESNWYSIQLNAPIPLEIEKSPYWPFIESFKIEKPLFPATQDLPVVVPAN